jgi:hypothetical protein
MREMYTRLYLAVNLGMKDGMFPPNTLSFLALAPLKQRLFKKYKILPSINEIKS